MIGLTVRLRKVVERKHTKARAANTLVPKLKMSFALKTAALSDPEARKSLMAFSRLVRGLPLLLDFPILVSVLALVLVYVKYLNLEIWNVERNFTLHSRILSCNNISSSFKTKAIPISFLYHCSVTIHFTTRNLSSAELTCCAGGNSPCTCTHQMFTME